MPSGRELLKLLYSSCDQWSSAAHGGVFRSGPESLEGDKAGHHDDFPDGMVAAGGTVKVASALGLNPPQGMHFLVQ